MYLQITTKCNMHCAHCCYSCNKNGKHMDYSTAIDAIAFCRDYEEGVSIGGGEPTLHPSFFDILRYCLQDLEYVWMATNGSNTKAMYRLYNIIHGEDYPADIDFDPDDEDAYYEAVDNYNPIYQEDKLSVALSQDCFHDPIDQRVIDLWRSAANKHGPSHFEIRDVSHRVIAQGRAKRTGSGWYDGCVCSDIIIKPDGKLRLCGCKNAPVIGDVWSGIEEKWQNYMSENERYNDTKCFNGKL